MLTGRQLGAGDTVVVVDGDTGASIARAGVWVCECGGVVPLSRHRRGCAPPLGTEFKSLLDSSQMFSQTPISRAYLDQSVSISAWRTGAGSVGYSFSFTCSASCPSLYALVTVNNLSTGSTYSREFWGSGTSLSGSGTASGLSSGLCRAVVTAFAPEPPAGMSSYYSQDWSTVNV